MKCLTSDHSEVWHRRHAMQIVMQLPENAADALLVLQEAHRLVCEFIGEDQALERAGDRGDLEGNVLPFAAPSKAL